MSGNPDPNTENVPRPENVPDWSCGEWGKHEHDWLSCYKCQTAYEEHLAAEQRGEPGVLHWERPQEFTAACGSRSRAITMYINDADVVTELAVSGNLYINPKVTCPLCIGIAEIEWKRLKPTHHETPAPEAHFD